MIPLSIAAAVWALSYAAYRGYYAAGGTAQLPGTIRLVTVGCCMHALIDMAQRGLSLAGLLHIHYPPMWASVDRRVADLQDLLGNEPWFLLEGLAFAALGCIALGSRRPRRWWVASAGAATATLTLLGLLSGTGVIGKVIVG